MSRIAPNDEPFRRTGNVVKKKLEDLEDSSEFEKSNSYQSFA
jgi:hypothetical protein